MKTIFLILAVLVGLVGFSQKQIIESKISEDYNQTILTTLNAPTETAMQVTVDNFIDVGCTSITLNYDNTEVIINSVSLHPALAGAVYYDWGYKIRIAHLAWSEEQTVTLPSGTILFTVLFTKVDGFNGTPYFGWSTVNGDCEYASFGGQIIYNTIFN